MMWFRKYCFEYFWSWFLNDFLKIWLYARESQKEAAKCSGIGPCTDAPKRNCYRIWPRLSLMEAAAMIFSRQSSPFIFNADLFSPGVGWVWETWLAHRLIFQYQMCIQVWLNGYKKLRFWGQLILAFFPREYFRARTSSRLTVKEKEYVSVLLWYIGLLKMKLH